MNADNDRGITEEGFSKVALNLNTWDTYVAFDIFM